ncbi:RHS repeat-associated core domain-containing protein, partial [Salmonella enterica subsp. enterica]
YRFGGWNAPNDESGPGCPWRYAGQWEDEESGLYYNRFRYYDSEAVQYLTPDPIGLRGGINNYAYVPNPLKYIDPLGLCKTDVENKNPFGTYRPDRPLPRDKYGNPIPDVDAPHTQLGTKSGRKGDYTQAREWGYDENGNLVPKRDIDFTDHGRPNEHPNPHQHDYIPNPSGGTSQHGPARPMEMPK